MKNNLRLWLSWSLFRLNQEFGVCLDVTLNIEVLGFPTCKEGQKATTLNRFTFQP